MYFICNGFGRIVSDGFRSIDDACEWADKWRGPDLGSYTWTCWASTRLPDGSYELTNEVARRVRPDAA